MPFNISDETPSTQTGPQATESPAQPQCFAIPAHDLHNHTAYCSHADQDSTVLNLLIQASELGLTHVGISEHVTQPADLPHIDRIRDDIRSVPSMSAQPLFGVEMDIDPMDPEGSWVIPVIHCDYVILSAHGFPQIDTEGDEDLLITPDLRRKRLAARWLRWYGNAVRHGECAILGHPLREPIAMNLINLSDPATLELVVATLEPAIEHKVAFELNEAFMTALRPSVYFAGYLELLARLRSMGMKFSRGSDSHTPLRMGSCDGITHVAKALGLVANDWLDASDIPSRSR